MILVDTSKSLNRTVNLNNVNRCSSIYVSARGSLTGSIKLEVSNDDETFVPLLNSAGEQVSIEPSKQGVFLRACNVWIRCDVSSASGTYKVIAQ